MEHLYRRVSAYGTKSRARSVRDLSSDAFRERTRLTMREIASQLLDHNWSGAPLVSSITRNHGGGDRRKRPCRFVVFGGANIVLARGFGEASWHHNSRQISAVDFLITSVTRGKQPYTSNSTMVSALDIEGTMSGGVTLVY